MLIPDVRRGVPRGRGEAQSMGSGTRGPRDAIGTLLLLALTLVGLGCGGKEQRKPVFPVKGSVFVAGRSATKALVIFHPLNDPDPKAPRPTGEVAADGTFTLSTHTAGDGAPAGEYAVTVTWPSGSSTIGGDADSG